MLHRNRQLRRDKVPRRHGEGRARHYQESKKGMQYGSAISRRLRSSELVNTIKKTWRLNSGVSGLDR